MRALALVLLTGCVHFPSYRELVSLPAHQPRTLDRPFPYRRVHRPAVPGHVLRQAHVDRQQAAGLPICDRQLRSSLGPAT